MDLSLERATPTWRSLSSRCFNPCFHGSLSRTPQVASRTTRYTGFNPCFHGSLSRTSTAQPAGVGRFMRFNPCFHGSLSRTRWNHKGAGGVAVFQSLFSWISLSNPAGPACHHPLTGFQSLFSWISLSNTYGVMQNGSTEAVSILVFMDLSLELDSPFWPFRQCARFNPCFHGSLSRTFGSGSSN